MSIPSKLHASRFAALAAAPLDRTTDRHGRLGESGEVDSYTSCKIQSNTHPLHDRPPAAPRRHCGWRHGSPHSISQIHSYRELDSQNTPSAPLFLSLGIRAALISELHSRTSGVPRSAAAPSPSASCASRLTGERRFAPSILDHTPRGSCAVRAGLEALITLPGSARADDTSRCGSRSPGPPCSPRRRPRRSRRGARGSGWDRPWPRRTRSRRSCRRRWTSTTSRSRALARSRPARRRRSPCSTRERTR